MSQFDRALGIFPTAAAVQARRLEVISGNIANANTPSYRARDVDFRQVLREAGDRRVHGLVSRQALLRRYQQELEREA